MGSKKRTIPKELRIAPQAGTCRWCNDQVSGRRRNFCSDDCVHQWMLRTDPSYLRLKVYERDKGICISCNEDTERFRRQLLMLIDDEREAVLFKRGYPEKWWPRSLWAADHVVAVVKGGGLCGLENIATICVPCHQIKTNQDRRKPS